MLVSKFKFCKEVIGVGCTGKSTAFLEGKLRGWDVPFDTTPGVSDCVDVIHLPKAFDAYAKEQAASPTPIRNGEAVQLVMSRLAELEDRLNKFTTEQIRWNGVFGNRLDQLTPSKLRAASGIKKKR